MHCPQDRLSRHENGYVTPPFHEIVLYQLHVGTFFTPNLPHKGGTFLEVARKLPYLAKMGVTGLQLMPTQEFQTGFSLGYNGTDYFSPEMDFAVADADLSPYVVKVNGLLDAKGLRRWPEGFREQWRFVQGQDHDIVYPTGSSVSPVWRRLTPRASES